MLDDLQVLTQEEHHMSHVRSEVDKCGILLLWYARHAEKEAKLRAECESNREALKECESNREALERLEESLKRLERERDKVTRDLKFRSLHARVTGYVDRARCNREARYGPLPTPVELEELVNQVFAEVLTWMQGPNTCPITPAGESPGMAMLKRATKLVIGRAKRTGMGRGGKPIRPISVEPSTTEDACQRALFQLQEMAEAALKRLHPLTRAIYVLRVDQGKNLGEIAKELDIGKNRVTKLWKAFKKRLEDLMQ